MSNENKEIHPEFLIQVDFDPDDSAETQHENFTGQLTSALVKIQQSGWIEGFKLKSVPESEWVELDVAGSKVVKK